MQRRSRYLYEFGPYRLDTGERLLLRDGEKIALPPKVFDTLVALVENRGRLVEKEMLIKLVWPDTFVEEGNLTNNVSMLRKTLGEGGHGQAYIETVPKLGYRFTSEVRELPATLIVERHSLTRIETEEDISHEAAVASVVPARRRQPQLKWKVVTGIAVVCLLIVGSLFVYRWWIARETARPVATNAAQLKSIAVLPFKTIGADRENEYLSQA